MRDSFSSSFLIGSLAGIISFFSWILFLSGLFSAVVSLPFDFLHTDGGAEVLSALFSLSFFISAVLRIAFFLLVPVLLYRILIRDRSFFSGFLSCIISLFIGMVFFGLYMLWTNAREIHTEREAQEVVRPL